LNHGRLDEKLDARRAGPKGAGARASVSAAVVLQLDFRL